MVMKIVCCETQFTEPEFKKQKSETDETNTPIQDHVKKYNTDEDYEEDYDSEEEWIMVENHVQKYNTKEDYDSEEEWNNGFMLEEHVQIQKDNAEEAKKEKERKEKEKNEDYDRDEDWNNLIVYDPNIKRVRCFANESLKWYNRQTGSKYKLKRVLEATATWCAGLSYVITFVAEECGSDDEPDEPALEYLKWVPEGDEKVVYNSGDDKPSDKLFRGTVYWKLPASKIKKHNTEEDYDRKEEWNNGFMLEEHVQIQKDNAEEAKKEEARKEEEREEDYDSDEDLPMGNSVEEDPNTKTVRCFANASLKWYNRQTGGKYKLKRVLEASATLVDGLNYEIIFIAEEGKFCFGQWLEPASEYLKWVNGPDEKVVYNSGDDKPSDKLFKGAVYWMRSGYIEVVSCKITTKEEVQIQKDKAEEANKYLKAENRKMRMKHIRTQRNPGRRLNGPVQIQKDNAEEAKKEQNEKQKESVKEEDYDSEDESMPLSIEDYLSERREKNKKLRIFWLALGISLYIIWILVSKTKE